MKKSTSYKEMLRDRCPKVVNYALKWQRAKERWIDHAYCRFIKIYVDSQERKHTTKIILGIAKFYRNFEFDKSIDWENLTKDEEIYWKRISSWVRWFTEKYAYIENAYEISKKTGKNDFDIRVEIINSYLSALLPDESIDEEHKKAQYEYIDKFVEFLINCFEGRI